MGSFRNLLFLFGSLKSAVLTACDPIKRTLRSGGELATANAAVINGGSDAFCTQSTHEESRLILEGEADFPVGSETRCAIADDRTFFLSNTLERPESLQPTNLARSLEARNIQRMRLLLVGYVLIVVICFIGSAPVSAGAVYEDVPSVVDPKAKYLFYMHGLAIERSGRRASSYNYSGILKALAERGFIVIGAERDPVHNVEYAEKVTGQVKKLLTVGVPAKNITVAGHSKGGMITMLVMSILAEPDIAYVNFAGCGRESSGFSGFRRYAKTRAPRARGRLLSAYDRNDQIAGSCKQALEKMTNAYVTERVLDNGGGHGLFRKPEAEWLDMLEAWAERRDK